METGPNDQDTAILNQILALLDQIGSQLDAADRVRGHDPWGAIAALEADVRRLARGLSAQFCATHAGLVGQLRAARSLHLAWGHLRDQVAEAMPARRAPAPANAAPQKERTKESKLVNKTLHAIENRRSIRAFQDRPIEREVVDQILHAAMRAPTAGNLMLYSIIEVADPALKACLARSCDNQPFIAQAPLVLLFLADYQRWWDVFETSGVPAWCEAEGQTLRTPGEGDLILACCDALIAAQTAAIAAESLGLGSCYIGDILENWEYHRELFHLPPYAFPVTLLCLGYPKEAAASRALTSRYPPQYVHFQDTYTRFDRDALQDMLADQDPGRYVGSAANVGQHVYARKFSADFSVEMTRSVRAAIQAWAAGPEDETP